MLKNIRVTCAIGIALVAAFALSACGPSPAIAGAGSDTTFDVMGSLASSYNNTDSADTVYNIPPTASGNYTVPADSNCGSRTYNSSNPPPNGSSAGISALVADTQGCIDFARSSRDRRSSDPSNLRFFAFGRDAVSWAAFRNVSCPGGDGGPAGCAPTSLSQSQLQGIYRCDQATPFGNVPRFTNWAQVGGDNEPIVRYLPQTGSGTLSFFETRILGLSSSQQGTVDDSSCAIRPTRIQENTGQPVAAGNRDNAILPYSYAQFTAQRSGTVPDLRAGAATGSINGVAPNPSTIGNNTFLGVRYVYNVAKQGSPSFESAISFMGVRSSGNGFLCANNSSTQQTISRFGFVPLSLAPAGPGLPNSRCRLNPAPL